MATDSLAGYIKTTLTEYAGISDAGAVSVDFLGMMPTRFSVRGEPSGAVVRRYLNGDTIRRYTFALEGMCDTISDADRQKNNALFEGLSGWMDKITKTRQLPSMANGARAMALESTGSVYLAREEESGDAAAYIMQAALTYYQQAQTD